jgi:predicted methyltransferase
MAGFILVALLGRALAQSENPTANQEQEARHATQVYDQAIIKFNTAIKDFTSWEAFKTEIFAKVVSGTLGRCYALTGSAMQPVQITMVRFASEADSDWQETAEKGWRRYAKANRQIVEYRVNEQAGVLLRMESIKPKFFFAHTQKICEFPL